MLGTFRLSRCPSLPLVLPNKSCSVGSPVTVLPCRFLISVEVIRYNGSSGVLVYSVLSSVKIPSRQLRPALLLRLWSKLIRVTRSTRCNPCSILVNPLGLSSVSLLLLSVGNLGSRGSNRSALDSRSLLCVSCRLPTSGSIISGKLWCVSRIWLRQTGNRLSVRCNRRTVLL